MASFSFSSLASPLRLSHWYFWDTIQAIMTGSNNVQWSWSLQESLGLLKLHHIYLYQGIVYFCQKYPLFSSELTCSNSVIGERFRGTVHNKCSGFSISFELNDCRLFPFVIYGYWPWMSFQLELESCSFVNLNVHPNMEDCFCTQSSHLLIVHLSR